MPGARNDILLTDAFELAAKYHRKQMRKKSEVPYLAHLLGVAALVREHGGSDEQAAAALLHDAPEDHGGEVVLEEIKRKCGKTVAHIVEACSDSLAADPSKKEKWKKRKKRFIKRLRSAR